MWTTNEMTEPAFRFDPATWLEDVSVQVMSSSSQGIYLKLLCRAWLAEVRGELSCHLNELPRLLRCTDSELELFLTEATAVELVELECERHGTVTLISKRMAKEEKSRRLNRLRQRRYRAKRACEARNAEASELI